MIEFVKNYFKNLKNIFENFQLFSLTNRSLLSLNNKRLSKKEENIMSEKLQKLFFALHRGFKFDYYSLTKFSVFMNFRDFIFYFKNLLKMNII